MTKSNRASIASRRPETALGFERFGLVGVFSGEVSREVGRGRPADVAPGPVCLLLLVFLRVRGHFRRKNNLGDNAKLALRADFWSATGPVLARRHIRQGNSNGGAAVEATFLACCAGVGFVPPARRRPPGATQRGRNRRSSTLDYFADVTLVRPRGRCRRRNNKGDASETTASLIYSEATG